MNGTTNRWQREGAILITVLSMVSPAAGEPESITRVRSECDPSKIPAAEAAPNTFGQTRRVPVHLVGKLFLVEPGQADKLIAEPLVTVLSGDWASFEDVTELIHPANYDPAILPEFLAAEAKQIRDVDGEAVAPDDPAPTWKTHSNNVVLPPFPNTWEKRDLGWKLKLRPRVAPEGSITLTAAIDQTVLRGFVDRGQPVTRELPAGLIGRAKTVTLVKNRQRLPVFLSRREEFELIPTKSGWVGLVAPGDAAPDEGEPAEFERFASAHCRKTLPGLRLELAAHLAAEQNPPLEAIASEKQVFISIKVIESSAEALASVPAPNLTQPILDDPGLQVLVRSLALAKDVDFLSTPSILVRDSQPGTVEVLRETIYPVRYDPPVLASGSGSAGSPEIIPATPAEFTTRNTGVTLGLEARLLPGGLVELDLESEQSELLEFLNFGTPITRVVGSSGESFRLWENRMDMPMFRRRTLQTTVRMPDGHSVVLGGLIRKEVQVVEHSMPLLGDLPLIGGAWRSRVWIPRFRRIYLIVSAKTVDPAGMPAYKPSSP